MEQYTGRSPLSNLRVYALLELALGKELTLTLISWTVTQRKNEVELREMALKNTRNTFLVLFSYIFARYSFDSQIANANREGVNLFFFLN